MNIADEIYYEQNPEALEQAYRDYLAENGMTEDECSFTEYCNEL